MVFFPYSLYQTHWSFIEEIKESEVNMAIEIRKEAQINPAECQYKNVDNSIINLTKTAQYTIRPRLTKGCKKKGQNRWKQQNVTNYLHIKTQDIEK